VGSAGRVAEEERDLKDDSCGRRYYEEYFILKERRVRRVWMV
jgi:hypothetical protein